MLKVIHCTIVVRIALMIKRAVTESQLMSQRRSKALQRLLVPTLLPLAISAVFLLHDAPLAVHQFIASANARRDPCKTEFLSRDDCVCILSAATFCVGHIANHVGYMILLPKLRQLPTC